METGDERHISLEETLNYNFPDISAFLLQRQQRSRWLFLPSLSPPLLCRDHCAAPTVGVGLVACCFTGIGWIVNQGTKDCTMVVAEVIEWGMGEVGVGGPSAVYAHSVPLMHRVPLMTN